MYKHFYKEISLRALMPYIKHSVKAERRLKIFSLLRRQELMGGYFSADLISLLASLDEVMPESNNFREAYRLSLLSKQKSL